MKKHAMLVAGIMTLSAALGHADIFYVDASRPDDSGAGTNWATAKKTIQAAVNLASAAGTGTVWVTNGVYTLGGAFAANASNIVAMGTNMTLRGLNGPGVTIIDGGGAARCVYVPNKATLEGFTVRNGYVLEPTTPSVFGAGVYVVNGGTVQSCIIESNRQAWSASGWNIGGGGVHLAGGGVLESCTIRFNSTAMCGGGVYCNSGGTLRNCLLYGNTAWWGGGMYVNQNATLINCTLVGNSSGLGGGLTMESPANIYLYNNVISGNSGAAEWALFTGSLPSNRAWNNCTTPTMGSNCVVNVPMFVDSANRNYHLTWGSPCVDTGSNYVSNTRDLDNRTRPIDGDVNGIAVWDIGAYEFQAATNAPELFVESPADLEVLPWAATNTTVRGTGHDVMGVMAWTNEATGASGQLTAGSPWTVNNVSLAVGTNLWKISGTNVYGQTTQAIARIERGGFGAPVVVPTTNEVHQPFSVVSLSGSNNAHVVGILVWSNIVTGLSGTLAVSSTWTTMVARLSDGPNPIVFTGTNLLGAADSATVTVTRTAYFVHYVSPSGSSQAPYTNWVTAATDLVTAVASAQDGDEIVVTSGTWTVASPLQLTNGIVVRSVPNTSPIIMPQTLTRCIMMNHPAAILDGFCVRNGYLLENQGIGAGILCSNGIVQNCVVVNCYAYDAGGGVNMIRGTIQNCTIVSNRTWYWTATGMRCAAGVSVVNCIIRFNHPIGRGEVNVQDFGATILDCATVPAAGTDCVTNDPLFVNALGNDYRLTGASPCIDTGADLTSWTDRDLAGRPRPLEGPGGPPLRFDIGAYEFAPFIKASAGANGTIAPEGEIPIDIGGSTSFIVTANAYYHIGSLHTNGGPDAAAEGVVVYTSVWNNVRTEGTVAADFAENLAPLGTPEWWLAQYGWTKDFDVWETNDTDSDSFFAWQEQIAGTDPTNFSSRFQVSSFKFQDSNTVLGWNATSGRVYSVDGSTNLSEGWFELATNLPPVGVWTVTEHGAEGVIHYRLGVAKP